MNPKRVHQRDPTKQTLPCKESVAKRPKFGPEAVPTQSMPSGPKGHPRIRVETLIKEHASVFNTEEKLRTKKGGPMKIKLKDGPIKPLHVNTPRKLHMPSKTQQRASLTTW